jgi:polyhydroxyalkanoate synthesis regulator phasin
MATRKRTSSRSKLLKRAVKAGRSALRQAEKRVPPDLRNQLERTIQDGQKTIHTAIKQVQARLDRTARQADLDKAMKRLEALSKQVRNLAAGRIASAAARPARRKPATRKPTARKPATRKPAARKPATRKPAARGAAPRAPVARRAAPLARRAPRRATARPEIASAPAPDSNSGPPDMAESSS